MSCSNTDPGEVDKGMSHRELALKTGIDSMTIYYFEKQGLVTCSGPEVSGERSFTPGDLQRLCFVQRALQLGFPVDDILELLNMRFGSDGERQAHRRFIDDQLEEIDAKIRDLGTVRFALESLREKSRCGREVSVWPVIDALCSRTASSLSLD